MTWFSAVVVRIVKVARLSDVVDSILVVMSDVTVVLELSI